MGKSEVYLGFNFYGEWDHDSRDGRTYRVSVESRLQNKSDILFTEVTSISGTAIAEKYGRSLDDDLPEIESLTFSRAKARLILGLYEHGKDYIQEIMSRNITNPEVIARDDKQVQYMILLGLFNLRKMDPQNYKQQKLDVNGFCQLLGINKNQYLLNTGILLEDGLIEEGKFDQNKLSTGGMFITSKGISFLSDLQREMKYKHTKDEGGLVVQGGISMNPIKENAEKLLKIMVEGQKENYPLDWFLNKTKMAEQDIIDGLEYLRGIHAIKLIKRISRNAGMIDTIASVLPEGKIIYHDQLKPIDIIPSVAISRDGRKGVKVEKIKGKWYHISNYDAYGVQVLVKEEPNGTLKRIEIQRFGALMTPDDGFGWGMDFDEAFPDIVLLAIGEYLDSGNFPKKRDEHELLATIQLSENLYEIKDRKPASESEIYHYIISKILWSWQFRLEGALFTVSDAYRLGIPLTDIPHLAIKYDNVLWERKNDYYFIPLPKLLLDYSNTQGGVFTMPNLGRQAFSDSIFIVHGHNEAFKQSVARVVERLRLKAIILHEQPNVGKTIIEKLESYSNVGFAIVLLSPDDIGKGISEPDSNYKRRARQNVIAELGYFIGKLGRERVCTLYMDDVEIPSDFDGVLYIPYDEAGNWRFELFRELKAVGYDVDANRLV